MVTNGIEAGRPFKDKYSYSEESFVCDTMAHLLRRVAGKCSRHANKGVPLIEIIALRYLCHSLNVGIL